MLTRVANQGTDTRQSLHKQKVDSAPNSKFHNFVGMRARKQRKKGERKKHTPRRVARRAKSTSPHKRGYKRISLVLEEGENSNNNNLAATPIPTILRLHHHTHTPPHSVLRLEMLLCKRELYRGRVGGEGGLSDRPGQPGRTTEVGPHPGLQLARRAGQVRPALDRAPDVAVDHLPVRSAVHRPRPEERERVVFRPRVVHHNVPHRRLIELLGEVDVDPEEVGVHLRRFDLLKERLEPPETRHVTADPEKFDPTQSPETTALLTVPDVLEDARKRRHTDTCPDQNGHFRLEHIFCRGAIGTIDSYDRQRAGGCCRIDFNKVTATGEVGV